MLANFVTDEDMNWSDKDVVLATNSDNTVKERWQKGWSFKKNRSYKEIVTNNQEDIHNKERRLEKFNTHRKYWIENRKNNWKQREILRKCVMKQIPQKQRVGKKEEFQKLKKSCRKSWSSNQIKD